MGLDDGGDAPATFICVRGHREVPKHGAHDAGEPGRAGAQDLCAKPSQLCRQPGADPEGIGECPRNQ
jgi:hypothetical protein